VNVAPAGVLVMGVFEKIGEASTLRRVKAMRACS
jgi:hypothetical protein